MYHCESQGHLCGGGGSGANCEVAVVAIWLAHMHLLYNDIVPILIFSCFLMRRMSVNFHIPQVHVLQMFCHARF